MSLSLPALDTLTGVILIGTWASSLLYSLEIIQGVYYFRHFEHDDWKFKTLVMVALVVDGLSFIGDYICVYEYTITHAGDLEYLVTVHWPLPLYGFTTGVLVNKVIFHDRHVFGFWDVRRPTRAAAIDQLCHPRPVRPSPPLDLSAFHLDSHQDWHPNDIFKLDTASSKRLYQLLAGGDRDDTQLFLQETANVVRCLHAL
ncbi:hypothetical protein B0H14DRAFT_3442169 [Mycena olivaceomarginata]|nr:hypothetical protein B0H14DRAFT_3442169 [Mycena olivaceomarginata]